MTVPTRGGGGGFPGCFTITVGLLAPALLGVGAAGQSNGVPFLVRLVIFLVVTAITGALVFGIWHFLRTTPVPMSREDSHDRSVA